jgi:ribosome biogenesis GTPase / thiamine phosphate phosphatase
MPEPPAPPGDLTFDGLGWTLEQARAFAPHRAAGHQPGRVISSGGRMIALTEAGPTEVVVQRRTARDATSVADLPAVGDWLALAPISASPLQGALREVLPRRSAFARTRPSDGRPQVIAANVDLVFLVSGLDHDLNLRRIERYLVLAMDGGVTPVVVLNKVDIAHDLARAVAEVHAVAAGTRVVAASALTGVGLDELRAFLVPGTTACLLGSSGVGKSTLTNRLLDHDRQAVRGLREDDSKGRHTTTRRELFATPGGGLIIDTPGLRTVGLLDDAAALDASFAEIDVLARDCRFGDCSHGSEPGCAVQAAIAAGSVSPERLDSYQRLEAERRSVELRADKRARREADRQLGRFYRHTAKIAVRHKRGEG